MGNQLTIDCVLQQDGINVSCTPRKDSSSRMLTPRDIGNNLKLNPQRPHSTFLTSDGGDVTVKYGISKEVLGNGSFGMVRKCICVASGQTFAVKTITKARIVKKVHVQREISVLKSLSHPNVLALRDCFEDSYHIHLVSPVYSGGQLFDKILDKGRFSEIDVASFVKQMLLAVDHCHSNDVVHRDVKPENFLFRSIDYPELVLIDFGFSRHFKRSDHFMKTRVGTVFYMAPEILGRKYTEKCDIWAIGIVMYVLLCGYFPFNGETDEETMQAILKTNLIFPEEEWGQVSEQAKNLLVGLLSPKYTSRFSAEDALRHPFLRVSGTPIRMPIPPHTTGSEATQSSEPRSQ